MEIHEEQKTKLKFPRSVFFIISNEFCERFSFYGMRTVLSLYLKKKLEYSENTAVVIYHTFMTLVYFFPLIGAMLADSLLGKFKTIFYLSVVYAVGQLLLSAAAVPIFHLPVRELTILGLFLIAIGSGGIKPCVFAFGGDQFILPQQSQQLAAFFSIFYFFISIGSVISTFLSPILREDVVCFQDTTCYSLAFFVPCVLMIIGTAIFLLGTPVYIKKKPEGNVIVDVVFCICHAISRKIKSCENKEHWLDHADDRYNRKTIKDIKGAIQVIKLLIPMPFFWALCDQQDSRWTFQAANMDGDLGFYVIKPDQILIVRPILFIVFIPIFERFIYPCIGKINLNRPLKKLVLGCVFACVSAVFTALVELKLEKTYPVLPSSGFAQVRVFNTLNCPIDVSLGGEHFTIKNLEMWAKKDFAVNSERFLLEYNMDYKDCQDLQNSTSSGSFFISEGRANSLIASASGLINPYTDTVDRSKDGEPYFRAIIDFGLNRNNTNSTNLRLVNVKNTEENSIEVKYSLQTTEREVLKSGIYDIFMNDELVVPNKNFKLGGVYTIVGTRDESGFHAKVATITDPNSMNMLWLLPQNIIITIGEVMFSITGLEFAYSQAPGSMKSLLTAVWLLTIAFGNLIVVIVAGAEIFDRLFYEFMLFAVLMGADTIVFAVMARYYKHVAIDEPMRDGISSK